MTTRLLLALFAVTALAFGQATMERQVMVGSAGPSRESEPKSKPTPEQLERGRQMLELAETQASGLEGGMRAYGLVQVARAYQSSNRKKALNLLEDALAATRGIDDDKDDKTDTRKRLQEQILQTMVPLAPQRVDELLAQVNPEACGTVLRSLLGYYQKEKDLDRAIEVLYRVAQEVEMPYDAAFQLMSDLPPERSTDAVQIFNAALASYRDHKHRGAWLGTGDFAALVTRNWSRLPKETVLEAIAEILKQAKANDELGQISMASAKGSAAFNSIYEYRLFQLLPVLKQLDESGAKKLLEEHQQVQAQLARYPQGADSINPPGDEKKGGTGSAGFMVSKADSGGGGGGGRARPSMSPLAMQQASKILADADQHPRDALAATANIADPDLRANTLQGIASRTWKKESSVAREALQKALDLLPQLVPQTQALAVGTAARLYLEMENTEDAKSAIERGLSLADKMFKEDSNADDPNTALKAYWPSAEAYRSMLRLAVKISPAWAQERAAEISDPEMKVLAQIAMAGSLLDVPAGPTTIVSSSKKGTNINISTER